MLNLLTTPPSLGQLEAIFAAGPPIPLLPPLGDPEWQRVARQAGLRPFIQQIGRRALQECAEPLPRLTDELYADFYHTGVRLRFEQVYFERRRRLARAVMAALLATAAALL